jgi:hypothetical protein
MRTALLLLLLATSSFAASYPGSPAAVVAAYIEADGAGKALDSDTVPLVLKYTTWKEAPGWDSCAVIKSYEIGEVAATAGKASVQITYQVAGQLSLLSYTAKPAKEEVSFDVVKTKGKWKIVSPQLAPHLTATAAIAFLKKIGAEGADDGKAAIRKIQTLE